jgi:hypothetical protein
VTVTSETVVPAPPRKLIWVLGEASLVPGSGETVIAFAAAAAAFAAGTELGRPAAGASPQATIANALPTAAAPSAARQIQRLVLSRDWSL